MPSLASAARTSPELAALAALAAPHSDGAEADEAHDVVAVEAQRAVEAPGERAARFLEALERFRGGDESARSELEAAASAMADLDGRADARAVAAHYLALDAAERASGLALEARFEALRATFLDWERLDARAAAEDWPAFVAELAPALERLVSEAVLQPDAAPAARAEALLARLELRAVEIESSLTASERAARVARAEQLARRSERRFRDAGFATPRLEPLELVGWLSRARGAAEEARAAFRACASLAEAVGRPAWRELGLLGLLALERDAGDPVRVRRIIAELATFLDPRTSWSLAREHAADLLQLDRADEALEFLAGHPPPDEDPGDPDAESARDEWHAMTATAHLRRGDLASAEESAAAIRVADGEHAILAHASLDLARGEASEALAALEPIVLGAPRGWSAAGRTFGRVLCGEALLALERPEEAAERLRAALDGALEWESSRPSARGSVLGEWIGLHAVALLARAELARGDAGAAALAAIRWQARGLRHGRDPSLDDVLAEAAGASLGLATWVVAADFTVALHVDPLGRASGEVLEAGREEVARGVRRLRQAIVARDAESAEVLGAQLAELLLPRRLLARITARTARASHFRRVLPELAPLGLVVVAHGPFERLPFSALIVDGASLASLGSLRVLPGMPSRATAEPLPDARDASGSQGAPARWVLAGDPVDERGRSKLPSAARELVDLAQIVPLAGTLAGASFTRERFAAALGGEDPVHVATHLVPFGPEEARARGELSPVSYECPVGLECSGGEVLSAADIAARAPRLPLVVLGACATADGELLDGEGALAIARAFVAGGTRGAVVTLWPVEDAAAREFALAFHAGLLAGERPSEATASARRALARAGRNASEWSAYRFIGRD